MHYGLSGRFIAKAGERDTLAKILLDASEELNNNPRCIYYVISFTDQPNDIWVSEAWTDKAAHDASLEPAEIRALISTAMPLIESMDSQLETQILGGKGVPLS